MTDVETFVTSFHNLQGSTIADKKRSFFHLLHANSSLHQNSTLLDTIISRLSIQTHLEKLFFVDLLIYFHRYEELSKEFLEGNDIIVSKISKQKWFFKKLFEENAAQFVNKFLPTLSYSLRLKILKRLVLILNEEQSDEIFDALHSRYGIFMASNILTSCSCDKIEEILRNHPIKLWTSQQKLLCNKQPQLLCVYLEECVKNEGNADFLNENPILRFIGTKYPEMFCYLLEKYEFRFCRVGKRSTRKIVLTKKDNVIAKPELYIRTLNFAHLTRSLGKDFETFYFKIFSRNVNQLFGQWLDSSRLLSRYTKKHRFRLFKETFAKVFYDSLEDSCIDKHNFHYLLELVTDNAEREQWARLKYETEKNDQFIKYFTSQNCLNSIVPKFNMFNQVDTRANYIALITESCLLNKDWQSLITVCELLCGRLKNDELVVHHTFFQTLLQHKFGNVFDHLTQTHWKYIKEIMLSPDQVTSEQVQILRRRFRTTVDNGVMMFKYFEFLCKNDTITDNEIIEVMKKINWIDSLGNFKSTSKAEKIILSSMIKVVPQVIHDKAALLKADINLILACKKYNSRYTGSKVSIFDHPRLIESVKDVLKSKEFDGNGTLASAIEWIICSFKTNIDEELIQLYWDNFEELPTFHLTLWLLKYRPNLIMTNIEMFVKVAISDGFLADHYPPLTTKSIWRLVKCYSHLQMDQAVIEHCLKKLADDDFEERKSLANPLSVIMSSKDFVRLVEGYKPDTATVDLLNEEESSKFEFQKYLLKALVKSNEPQDVVSVLLQFLRGDYVASCLSPLYSCLYKIPENHLKTVLDKLCTIGAVSVKKHGFYFICATQDESTILQKLESCHLTQSIAMSYQHFTKNPSQLSWELVKKKLTKLDNNDHFTSLVLVNKPAPKLYKAVYFETAFGIFREKGNKFTNVLVNKLPEEVIGQLTNRFFENLKDDFLTMEKSDLILSYYLLYCPEVFKYEVTFNALRLFKEKQWSLRSHEAREKLNQFVKTFYAVYMKWDKTDISLTTTFMEGFVKIFPPVEAFEEYIMLSVMQFKNQNTLDFSKSLIGLHNHSISCYGKLVFEIFSNCLKQIVDKLYSDEICKIELYNSLLDAKKSVEDELLVIYLVPRKRPLLRDSALLYLKMMDVLRRSDNEAVQLHLHQCFDREEPKNKK